MPHACEGKSLTLEDDERWFLVHTLPRGEMQASLHLGAQGFRSHLPQIIKTVRHARQLRTVRAPLFPRYLFIILDTGRDRWLSVRSTVGVSSLFTCNGRPVPVPRGIVESLIENMDGANLTLLDAGLREGQRVRILSGPFADLVGTLGRLDAMGRVRVLLDMMGSAVPVALYRSALAPAA
jgi:transcription elongation factor/antiterminator RfaH